MHESFIRFRLQEQFQLLHRSLIEEFLILSFNAAAYIHILLQHERNEVQEMSLLLVAVIEARALGQTIFYLHDRRNENLRACLNRCRIKIVIWRNAKIECSNGLYSGCLTDGNISPFKICFQIRPAIS